MGLVIPLESRRARRADRRLIRADQQLPLMLAQLLAAGATDFARVALDAWGKQEMQAEELVELCSTYASVAGFENVSI